MRANLVQVILDLLVDAVLQAPLDKGKLADCRPMCRVVDFLKDVRAATERIKKKSVLLFELVLLIQIGINDRRADLHQLRAALGKIRHGPVKGSKPRTL